MMNLKFCATLVFMLSVPLIVLGQNGTIKGKVRSTLGEALPGANVQVQGLTQGDATDSNGEFTISSVPAGTYTVEVKFIGYKTATREVTVSAGQTVTVNFRLQADVLFMDAIVVTGTRQSGRTKIQSPVPIDSFEGREI